MNASKLTTRVLTIALAMAASACHQRGALAADPADPEAPVATTPPTPPTPPAAPTPPTPPMPPVAPTPARGAKAARPGGAPGQPGAFGGGGGGKSTLTAAFGRENVYRVPAADAPAVLVTEPIDAKVQAEWKEDLNVMDKLLRDAAGGPEQPWIKVTMMAVGGRAAPMYVEGAGVILSTTAGFPLAPAGKDADGPPDRPRERASAWIKAQRELKGYGVADRPMPGEAAPVDLEHDKVDAFVASVLKVLR
jgi:hypothetical protein